MPDRAPVPPAASPSERPARRPGRPQHVLRVLRTERITPDLQRVHLAGAEAFLAEADDAKLAATDRYVKLLVAPAGTGLVPPFDLAALRETTAPEDLPVSRTYTVRSFDRAAGTIAIDFVVHGTTGIAGPWAAAARPGDLLALSGPGGGYAPDPDPAVFHLLLGDDSAIPAIASALEALPAEARGVALLEVDGPEHEQALRVPAGIRLRWVHRRAAEALPGTALVAAAAVLPRPDGPIEVFAHGERSAMKALRALLQDDWGLPRRDLSLSAYWALGRAEDAFQAEKREPVGAIFAD